VSNLISVDIGKITQQVTTSLRNYPQFIAAYLFGSALEQCRPDSDIDIGLVLDPRLSLKQKEVDLLKEDVLLDLGLFDSHPYDVTVIALDSPLFSFKVVKQGQPIYVANSDLLGDFVEKLSRIYGEVAPRYFAALQEIIPGVDIRDAIRY